MEFDPDLSDDLYVRAEIIDLSNVYIRLDIFLSGIGLSKDQDDQIRTHLRNFSTARLSNWLPWLNSKVWTGRTLLAFIQFHNHWENTPEWWESRWHHRIAGWEIRQPTMSNILSRDNAYQIVHQRIHLHPDEMIDPLWLEEWGYHSLWRYGFYSFATFAHFRARLNDYEEWESLIGWHSYYNDIQYDLWLRDDMDRIYRSANGRIPVREDDTPHPIHSFSSSVPRWYAIQDWYEEYEWHDNLGWALHSMETPTLYNLADSSQGPIWPIGGRNE